MTMIRPIGELRQRQPSQRFTPEERRYYAWLGQGTCCLTGYPEFQIAHGGKKHMGLKAPLYTCLPLRAELHRIEERARMRFWEQVGIPDHLEWAKQLYGCFTFGGQPSDVLSEMINTADRVIIADMLTNPNNF